LAEERPNLLAQLVEEVTQAAGIDEPVGENA
jgi:hypothetical protein